MADTIDIELNITPTMSKSDISKSLNSYVQSAIANFDKAYVQKLRQVETKINSIAQQYRQFASVKMSTDGMNSALTKLEQFNTVYDSITAKLKTLNAEYSRLRDHRNDAMSMKLYGNKDEQREGDKILKDSEEQYKEYGETIDKLERLLISIEDSKSQLEQEINASNENTDAYGASLQRQFSSAVDEFTQIVADAVQEGNAYTEVLESIKDIQEDVSTTDNSEDSMSSTDRAIQYFEELAQAEEDAKNAEVEYYTVEEMLGNSIIGLNQKLLATVTIFATSLPGAVRGAISVMGSLSKTCLRLGISFIKNLKNKAEQSANSVARTSKRLLMLGLGARSLFFLLRKLRTAFVKAFQDMAKKVPEVNKEFSAMKVAMANLKGAFITAFEPLRMVAMPIISQVASALTNLINLVAKFNAVLTGKALYKATAGMYDYAKARSGASKLFTASFDTLNQIGDDGSGSSEPELTYEQIAVDADDAVSLFAQMVKKAWMTGDFTQVGTYVSIWLNRAFEYGINLMQTTIQPMLNKVAVSIATFFNGMFKNFKLADNIGKFIAEWKSKLWRALYEFVTTFDWKQFGIWLAIGITSALNNFDWAKFVGSIAGLINGLITTLSTLFNTIDLSEVGEKIFYAIFDIDIMTIAYNLAILLTSIVQQLVKTLPSIIVSLIWIGEQIVFGLLGGILQGLSDISTWLWDNIVNPIITAVKDLFGIHSPSTVFAEMGVYLTEGLLEGLKARANAVLSWFVSLKQVIVDTVNSVVTAIWDVIKGGINTILSGVQALVNGVVNALNSVMDALNSIGFDVPDWLPVVGGKSFRFNLQHITAPQIPMLAQGAVIPPNAPFMAMLGDQKNGTNIEAPLDTLIDAFRQVQGEQSININFTGNLSQLARVLKPAIDKENSRVGGSLVSNRTY